MSIEETELTRFRRFCEASCGVALPDWNSLHRFSIDRYRDFWRLFVAFSQVDLDGAMEPVCAGGTVEKAVFFPEARLNFVAHLLRSDAPEDDARPALIALDERGGRAELTRAELRERVLAVARGLSNAGARAGDRVCAVASNTMETVIACLGSLAIGATWSCTSPDMGVEAIGDRLGQLEPRILFYDSAHLSGGALHDVSSKIATIVATVTTLERTVALRGDVSAPAQAARPHVATTLLQLERDGELAQGPGSLRDLPRLAFSHPLYILFSSGTTGRPKCIVHGAGGTLLEHYKEHRLHCAFGPQDRLYFHTTTAWMMWNWLISALACKTTIVLYEGAPTYPHVDSLWEMVARERVTVFGTSPSFLQFSRDSGVVPRGVVDLSSLRAVQSTGSILPDALFHWIREAVGEISVQSISGGTDILGCFLLGNPNLPVIAGELQCKSLGLDVDVAPREPPPEVRARHPLGYGELICKTPFPSRPLGLLHDADGARFHDAYFSQHEGVWSHGDLLELSKTGGGRIHGRCDGVLNILGVRIGPSEIYRAIEGITEIAGSMAIEFQEETGHGQLVLLVVLREGKELDADLRRRIVREITARTSRAHVPSLIVSVSELPATWSGKASERAATDAVNGRSVANLQALRNPASLEAIRRAVTEAREVASRAHVSRGETTRDRLRAVWEDVLRGPVGDDDTFFDAGGQSLTAVALLSRVSRTFGVTLPISSLVHETPTISKMVAVLEQGHLDRTSSIVPLAGAGSGSPVFWVPGGGGLSVLMFRELSLLLGSERPVYGFEQDIRATRPAESLEEVASAYVDELLKRAPHEPYTLLGFSNGGWTAFEMTRQIEARGGRVGLLAIFDTEVPIRLGALALARGTAYRARYQFDMIRKLSPRGMLDYANQAREIARERLQRQLGALGIKKVPSVMEEQDAPVMIRELDRRNRRITAEYSVRTHAKVSAPVTLVLAKRTSRSALPAELDGRYGWRQMTEGAFDVVEVEASHLSMLTQPDVTRVAEQLREVLRRPGRRASVAGS